MDYIAYYGFVRINRWMTGGHVLGTGAWIDDRGHVLGTGAWMTGDMYIVYLLEHGSMTGDMYWVLEHESMTRGIVHGRCIRCTVVCKPRYYCSSNQVFSL